MHGIESIESEIDWREHNIHDEEGSDDDEEDYNKDVLFHLFAPKEDPFEDLEFDFEGIPKIAIKGQTECTTSTGLGLWIGSENFCEYLIDHRDVIEGKKILELGAGLGLCGLVTAHLGASSVLLTDGDTTVLKTLRQNISRNIKGCDDEDGSENSTSIAGPSPISCRQLIWGANLHAFEKVDVILAANCVYITKSLEPFFRTLNELLNPNGVVVYVNPCASQAPLELVLETAASYKFKWSTFEHASKMGEHGTTTIFLFRRE